MLVSRALNPRRIARTLVTVLALTLLETIAAPIIAPQISTPASHAVSGSIEGTTSSSRTFITIPAGVESISVVVWGAGGGQGGSDGNLGGSGGLASKITVSFNVTPGDVVALFPGKAGSNGGDSAQIGTSATSTTGVGGTGNAGPKTTTDSYWSLNTLSTQNPDFRGGAGGKVGGSGSSGGGGGGGAASVVAINRTIVAVAGGAGGGGGAGNSSGAQGTDGTSTHTPNANQVYGANGFDSGSGNSCTAADGGGGGGGGGGYYGGAGGQSVLVGGECSGRGGSIGSNYVESAYSAAITTYNPSTTKIAPANGIITYSYDVKSPTTCTPTTTIVDIYTVLKFDASINCTWTVPSNVTVIDIFAVGGGGGGGDDGGTGGGGGAGLSRSAVPVTPNSSVTVRVGYGGSGGLFNAWSSAFGETSTVTTTTSTFNAPGGQGGGNRASGRGAGGSATSNATFSGGAGGVYPSALAVGGAGNYGISNYFFGTQNTYAGGGGGGCYYNAFSNATGPVGRNGGGAGCSNTSASGQTDGIAGTAGTGGGGGAGGAGEAGRTMGGKGGSGVILIRYATDSLNSFPANLTSNLVGRYNAGDAQLLDSSRKKLIDSSGGNAPATINGSPNVISQSNVDGSYSTGSTKSVLTLTGSDTASVTGMIDISTLGSNYTLFTIARYPSGASRYGRVITASTSNWMSGLYNTSNDGVAYHNSWITPTNTTNTSSSYKWLLSTDQSKLYRSNGKDVTYHSGEGAVSGASDVPSGFGINVYSTELTYWQVSDVLVFNKKLLNGEIRAVEKYLMQVYGLSMDPRAKSSETDTAVSFDGTSNSEFWYGYGVGNNLNDTFTIEAWVNPASNCNTSDCIIASLDYSYVFNIYNGTLQYALWSAAATGWVYIDSGVKIPANQWSHVALVKRGQANTNDSLDMYLNGKLVFTKKGDPYVTSTTPATFNSAATVNPPNGWHLIGGRDATGYAPRYVGLLDEFKIWKIARTASQIATDMSSADLSDPNMTHYYDFNKDVSESYITVSNLAYGGVSRTDIGSWWTPVYVDVKTVSTSTNNPYTTITFPRSYITQNGGWKVPAGISLVQVAVVGGGGGGGGGYQGGGGGAGGFIETLTTLVPGNIYPIKVGVGGNGHGNINPATTTPGTSFTAMPTNGETSTAFGFNAIGGGYGSSEFDSATAGGAVNINRIASSGGSGGGGGWGNGASSGGLGTAGQGNAGGSITQCCTAAGGGGAGSVGMDGTTIKGGDGGAGKFSTVLQKNVAGGGGGSMRTGTTTAAQGLGGSGIGGNSAYTNNAAVGASGGATNGAYGTGSGGGAGMSTNGSLASFSGSGGSGVVALRYITALVPSYTKPTNAYLNVGMTETFTTNVAQDSATAVLTRTFKWESTTPTANGVYTTLKVGTGAANASYSWVPSDTSTSGSGYLYRLTVTDSDTAGLLITDSSTAFAIINPALRVSSTVPSGLMSKRINISRNETYTITLGTPTYRATLSPVIPGISIDTSTPGTVVLKIGETATVGTWLETLTVTDSVSASVVLPLTITVTAPPTLLNTNEIITNGLVFNLDAGNSASILLSDLATTTSATWSDLSGRKNNATTGAAVNTGGYSSTGCTAPTYSSDNGGAIVIAASSDNCYYSPFTGREFEKSYTFEAWFKTSASIPAWGSIISQGYTSGTVPISVAVGSFGGSAIFVGFFDGGTWRYANCGYTPTVGQWTHIAGTYDGTTMYTYINGSNIVNGAACSASFSGGFPAGLNSNGMIIGKGHMGGTGSYTFPGSIASVRLYNIPLTSAQILQNYNATKYRFDSSNQTLIKPVKKYGVLYLESFTATSGLDTKTVSFAVGDRIGIDWDTTTVTNQVKLSVQESLSAGTYYDTMTVTDSLGQSTYLPIKFTVTQADTLTVYVDTPTALNYTGNQATLTPTLKLAGALGLEVGATISGTINYKPGGGTCASGGYCRVGDIGPAGGIIFIDTSTAGSDGRIYEAAPYNWTGTDDLASISTYCSNNSSSIGTATAIGQGETNTTNAKNSCLGGAVAKINTFNASNTTGYANWFIPSSSEAAAMVAYADQMGLIRAGSNWSTGTLGYWTSSESTTTLNRILSKSGSTFVASTALKSEASGLMVRPVRAFRACWAIDTCTAQSVTTIPTNAGLYSIVPSAASVSTGSLSNYVAVNYQPTPLTINKVAPRPINIPWINTKYPDTFTVTISLYAGNGALKYSAVNGTANGCAMDYKKIYTTSQGTCTITVTRYADRNFLADTTTATILFLAFVNSQPTNQVGGGSTIGLNGQTSLTIDDSSTVRVPRITGFSLSGSTLTINGEGFGSSPVTVTFERYVDAASPPTPTGGGTVITVSVPGGAVSGPVLVITAGGRDSIDWLDIP